MAESQYSDLYKNNTAFESKQSERRQQLLKEQKEHRNNDQDNSRNIEQFLQNLKHKNNKKKTHKRFFKDQLQLSEWLYERPNDMDNWFLVPCPNGKRCLVVATNGSTKTYTKYGVFQDVFRSGLPGDIKSKSTTTILDCICVVDCNGTKLYMVLDVMYYANTDMLNCETSFRFFWIGCKLTELNMETVNLHNEFAFKPMKHVDCSDEIAVDSCLTTFPMWDDDKIELDGLLFYHKDSSYVNGKTPLVGWLYPFMVNEVLGFVMLNPKYLEKRPGNYVNAAKYIEQFESEQKKRRNHQRRTKTGTQKMEEDPNDDSETLESLLDAEKKLEVDGETVDDIYFEKMDGDCNHVSF